LLIGAFGTVAPALAGACVNKSPVTYLNNGGPVGQRHQIAAKPDYSGNCAGKIMRTQVWRRYGSGAPTLVRDTQFVLTGNKDRDTRFVGVIPARYYYTWWSRTDIVGTLPAKGLDSAALITPWF
jgi:hypothetical protein